MLEAGWTYEDYKKQLDQEKDGENFLTKCREIIKKLLDEKASWPFRQPVNINEMYIGTFHSICLRIIKEHLEYTRIKKNFRTLDDFDQRLHSSEIEVESNNPHFNRGDSESLFDNIDSDYHRNIAFYNDMNIFCNGETNFKTKFK